MRPAVLALLFITETCGAAGQTSIAIPTIEVGNTPSPGGAPGASLPGETQPTSVIGRSALDANVSPTGNYDDAIRLSPSVLDISPNGPGLGEAQTLSIRGFTDGQYNVTFDGVPFADSDDFTHHSSAYFVTRDLSSVAVDRGPGDATTIGDATFGGTVALASIAPATTGSISPTVSLGSFDTKAGGLLLDSGRGGLPGGASGVLDIEADGSHGALDGSAQRRSTMFGKFTVPLDATTALTIATNLSATEQGEPLGATRAQIAAYGPAFALNTDPGSQAFEAINSSTYRTDITVADITSTLAGGVSLSEKAYSYGLDRRIRQGFDPNGETPDDEGGVPAQSGRNGLRAWGDILRVALPLTTGLTLQAGAWLERQVNSRFLIDIDQPGGLPDPNLAPVAGVANSAAIVRQQRETLVTAQPFVQLDWQVLPNLLLTAGLKGAWFDRSVQAPVMEAVRQTLSFSSSNGAPLPSFAARWRIEPAWSLYAQAARGFLAPALQLYDVTDPRTADVPPEQTWNFQVGTQWRTHALVADADIYDIVFDNAVGSRTVGGETEDFDEGGVAYRGIEAQATRALAYGFSLYGNGSANQAHVSGSNGGVSGPAPVTPQATLTGGLLFQRGSSTVSLIDHWVGGAYGDVGRTAWIDPFNELDLSAATAIRPGSSPPITLRAQLFNLLDSRKVDGLAGYTVADGTRLFWTQAGLSLFVSATSAF